MRVLVMGANGDTGFRVVRRLREHPEHEPVAMVRERGQAERFEEIGVAWVEGDLEHPIDEAVAGCDAVIFAAGSGGATGKDKTVLIDHLGAIRAMVAALEAGAKRFVMLSGLKADRDYDGDSIPHWRRAKGRADHFLQTMPAVFDGRGLDWTIVCPGRLGGDGPDDAVAIISPDGDGETSRDNLATALVACLDEPATIGRKFGLVDGAEAVSEALRKAGG